MSLTPTLASLGFGEDTPLGLPGAGSLLSWHDSALGKTIGDTPKSGGTSPPVVTLSGSLSRNAKIRIEINAGGTRGTATFDWYLNGVLQASAVTTSATVALGSTGIFANFATGTYNADNFYDSLLNAWADQSGNGYTFSESSPTQQPAIGTASLNGFDGLRGDGTNTLLTNTGGWANTLIGGSDKPFAIFYTAKWITLNGADNSCAVGCGSSSANNHFLQVGATTSVTNFWRATKHDGTTQVDRTGGTFDTTAHHFCVYSEDGTTVHMEIDGSVVTLSSSGFDVASMTSIDRGTFFGVISNGAQIRKSNLDLYNVLAYTSGLTSGIRSVITAYSMGRYAL